MQEFADRANAVSHATAFAAHSIHAHHRPLDDDQAMTPSPLHDGVEMAGRHASMLTRDHFRTG
jgi:hypothetical protein